MAEQHPIAPPPPELVEKWYNAVDNSSTPWRQQLATKAARWGADQELEACCHLLWLQGFDVVDDLRATRRPKPPSLKEQALQALGHLDKGAESQMDTTEAVDTIRRALERLQELEGGND